jgi:hypothetical protein
MVLIAVIDAQTKGINKKTENASPRRWRKFKKATDEV